MRKNKHQHHKVEILTLVVNIILFCWSMEGYIAQMYMGMNYIYFGTFNINGFGT